MTVAQRFAADQARLTASLKPPAALVPSGRRPSRGRHDHPGPVHGVATPAGLAARARGRFVSRKAARRQVEAALAAFDRGCKDLAAGMATAGPHPGARPPLDVQRTAS